MGRRHFSWSLKGVGKRPNGPRLPIGAVGGQVVLNSKLQTPLDLQDQDAPAVKKPAEACCFHQAGSVAKTQLPLLRRLCGGAYGLRLHKQG